MQKELVAAGNAPEDVAAFRRGLFRADYATIDEFLGAHRRESTTQRIGRQAIALCISGFEDEKKLFSSGPHWYKRLLDFLRRRPDLLKRHCLRFYTFNYDRSFEFYLHEAVAHSGGNIPTSFREEFFLGNFHHLHGTLGHFGWQKVSPDSVLRDYGQAIPSAAVKAIGDGIVTPDQEVTLDTDLRQHLMESDIVAFMGFGFHEQNLAKIDFAALAKRPNKKIYATVTALELAKRDFLKSIPAVKVFEMDCSNFIAGFIPEMEAISRA